MGLVSGYSRINGKPITDLTGVTAYERLGTDQQTATGMGDRAEFPRMDKVLVGTPVTFLMPDSDYDDLAIMLSSPEGLIDYTSDGDRVEARLGVKIEIRPAGGAWHTLMDHYVFGETINPVRWLFLASGTYQGGTAYTVTKGVQHEWRVSCTHRYAHSNYLGLLHLEAAQEIYGDDHRFPGMPYLEIRAFAKDELDGLLEFNGVLDGLILEPIDPLDDIEWSDNPARVMKFLFTRPVILGDGSGTPYSVEYYRGYDPSKLNQADFLAYEAWCDELVPDGKGGTRKRFKFNGRFADSAPCWEQAAKVGAMSRAVPWYDGQQVRVYIDKPAAPKHLYCVSNMVKNSFREQSTDPRMVPSKLEIEIRNEDADWATQRIRAIDHLGTYNHTEQLDGFGCTSIPQFMGLANFLFDKARNQDLVTEWMTVFGVGLDAEVGEVAYVQNDANARAIGGLVVSGSGSTVVIDKAVSMDLGKSYVLIVQTIDDVGGKHVTSYDVASLTDPVTVVLTTPLTYVPVPGNVFIFAENTKVDMYRIVAIQWQPDGCCRFIGEQYKAAYFTRDNAAPSYDTSIHLAGTQAGRKGWTPVTRQDLLNSNSDNVVYLGDASGTFSWGDLTFTGNGVDRVTWEGTGEGSLGRVSLRGVVYPINGNPSGTTQRYVYFDPNIADPRDLQSTNEQAEIQGQERYVLGENRYGVWMPWADSRPATIDGNQLRPGSIGTPALTEEAIETDKLANGAVTNEKIDALAVTADKVHINELSALSTSLPGAVPGASL